MSKYELTQLRSMHFIAKKEKEKKEKKKFSLQ